MKKKRVTLPQCESLFFFSFKNYNLLNDQKWNNCLAFTIWGKIPCAVEQLSPCATATQPVF